MSYATLLDVAVDAARAAGALLRDDFLKAGGPSGAADHADADKQAEWLIRERLLAATPGWSYLGEETGGVAGNATSKRGPRHIWLVDPNDGTTAYLKGFRGSAVSIGLLRDGRPVLGVVYAFAAPDNDGDLFAWAEGCGPIVRNGVPVTRQPWATVLAPDTVVIVSQAADRAATANLACVAPGRVRAMASVAYRMALVACGEGEAGSSLAAPGGWDYAGGHALLRASGGTLIDETSTVITYSRDGRSHARACFFGAPALVGTIASRTWARMGTFAQKSHPASPSPEAFELCWPLPGATIAATPLLQRAQGCLLGQLAGDALGSMVEFQPGDRIRQKYGDGPREIGPSPVWGTLAGQPTDDSELALILARTLLRGGFTDEDVAGAYGHWLASDPFDIGGTIGQATRAIVRAAPGTSKAGAARAAANQESQANGALMRQSPLAIWGHSLASEALDNLVRQDTRLTHPNKVCQDASAAFIVALSAVIREGWDGAAAHELASAWHARHGSEGAVAQALAAARHERPDYEHHTGHVIVALQNAFYQALHAPSFEEGVVDTVRGGGDTDTNGAIAGALLGALHGAPAIPSQWRQAVLTCRPLQGAAGVRNPTGPEFWPVDALCLAERLLVAGTLPIQG